MTASLRCLRPLTGNLLVAITIGLLIVGAIPASAQSPVANPPIKVVHIYEQACPAGVDPAAGSVQDAMNACPGSLQGVTFTLTSRSQSFQSQTQATNSSGDTEFRAVPSGFPYAIQESVPAGYGAPLARCQFFFNLDNSIPDTERSFQGVGGYLDIGSNDPTLANYQEVACYWFDIPIPPNPADSAAAPQAQEVAQDDALADETPTPELEDAQDEETQAIAAATPESIAAQGGGTRLDIRAWQCPFHYDAAVATVDELFANCTSPHRDANFIINGDPSTQQYTGDIGATSYQNVPFGTVTIQQLAYSSFDPVRVFCYTQPFTASHGPLQASQEIGFTEEPGDTFSVSINVNPGDAIDCIWFDAWITEDDNGTVLLHKYACPDGTDPAGLTMDQLLQACPTPQTAYFQLLLGSGNITGSETDANGYLGFINFSPGSYAVQEIAPLDFAPARIFCRSYNAADWNHVGDPYIEQPMTNNGSTVQLQAHWETECVWFNSKGANYGYLDIIARGCPLNFNPTANTPRNTFAQRCQTGISGARFDVDSYPNLEGEFTSSDGYALFQEPVTVGSLTVSSTDPQTYIFVRAYCGDAPYIGIGAIPTSWTSFANGFVQYDVPVDYQVVCEFYYKPIAIVTEGAPEPETAESPPDQQAPAQEETSPEVTPSGETGNQSGNAAGVTGQLFACPGTTVIKAQCTPAAGPATLHFDSVPGASAPAFELQFGNDGTAQADPPPGTYALTGLPFNACVIESDAFDASGRLVVTENVAVQIRVYLCGA